MFCFVLMKLKSHFIGFSDERSLQRLSVKNARAFYSLPLYPIIVSICVCSLPRLSQISSNPKFRNVCEKFFSLSVACENERVSPENGSVHVSAIQYFCFTIPRRRTENSKIDTLSCFPFLYTSNQQTVLHSIVGLRYLRKEDKTRYRFYCFLFFI